MHLLEGYVVCCDCIYVNNSAVAQTLSRGKAGADCKHLKHCCPSIHLLFLQRLQKATCSVVASAAMHGIAGTIEFQECLCYAAK